jgi:dTDP-glucose pyrophosphorylase
MGSAMTDRISAATLDDILVEPAASILDTMRVIDRSGLEIALVCDARRTLLAVATDGDIRRAIIAGKGLDTAIGTVANRRFTALTRGGEGLDGERGTALALMVERGLRSLPVIDAAGRLVDLHSLRSALRGRRSDSWAVVMAGGKGERLGELTAAIPKPMLPIGDRPILERIVQHLVSHGIHRIFLAVNHYGKQIEDHFGDGTRFMCRIEYLWETQPLGTGGPLALLPEAPRGPLVVMNGDLLTSINLSRLLAFHRAGDFKATVALREHVVRVPFGVAELDGARVARLVEKPTLNYRINAGIYALDPDVVARVPKGRMFPITELLDGCLSRREAVGAYHMQETWNDIGLPEEYARSQSG